MNRDYRKWFRDVYQYTPHWSKVRALVLERANYRCEHCGTTKRPLQVHHYTYKFLHFEDKYLSSVTLCCVSCHKKLDQKRVRLRAASRH